MINYCTNNILLCIYIFSLNIHVGIKRKHYKTIKIRNLLEAYWINKILIRSLLIKLFLYVLALITYVWIIDDWHERCESLLWLLNKRYLQIIYVITKLEKNVRWSTYNFIFMFVALYLFYNFIFMFLIL